jgi:hypothetical protein
MSDCWIRLRVEPRETLAFILLSRRHPLLELLHIPSTEYKQYSKLDKLGQNQISGPPPCPSGDNNWAPPCGTCQRHPRNFTCHHMQKTERVVERSWQSAVVYLSMGSLYKFYLLLIAPKSKF